LEARPAGGAGRAENTLRGRDVYLRAVLPEEYEDLYLRETSGSGGPMGGLEGSTPGFEEWVRQTAAGSLARFVILRSGDHRRLGLGSIFNADLGNGHAHIALSSFDPTRPSPLVMMGAGLLIEHAFACWPFHKLYLDVAEYNLGRLGSGQGRLFEVEGTLRDHHFQAGRRWDHHILAVYRAGWKEYWSRRAATVLESVSGISASAPEASAEVAA
jgi:hypothetical protein